MFGWYWSQAAASMECPLHKLSHLPEDQCSRCRRRWWLWSHCRRSFLSLVTIKCSELYGGSGPTLVGDALDEASHS